MKKKSSKLPDKTEYGKIRRILRKNDQGDGVSEQMIIQEAGMKPQKTSKLIYEMRNLGWIYEIKNKCWRLTHG